jgi:hypothetical protein
MRTQIELNVVAADLSMRRQFVFSHLDTPDCGVADAVAASCSIPFAFPSRILAVPEAASDDSVYHHTIVDGGVWANFPIFVFADPDFRGLYEREPREIHPEEILGFLLGRTQEKPNRGNGITFYQPTLKQEFRAKEWFGSTSSTAPGRSLGPELLSWLLFPFEILGRMHEWNDRGVNAGRWPRPQAKWKVRLLRGLNGYLAGIGLPGGGFVNYIFPISVIFMLVLGAWSVSAYVTNDAFRSLNSIDWKDTNNYMQVVIRVVVTLGVYSIALFTVVVGLLGIASNFLLLRPARKILYGLITTYVAGPGAPAWFHNKQNIVVLPVPPDLKTLSFDVSKEDRERVIKAAEAKTMEKLREAFSEGTRK